MKKILLALALVLSGCSLSYHNQQMYPYKDAVKTSFYTKLEDVGELVETKYICKIEHMDQPFIDNECSAYIYVETYSQQDSRTRGNGDTCVAKLYTYRTLCVIAEYSTGKIVSVIEGRISQKGDCLDWRNNEQDICQKR